MFSLSFVNPKSDCLIAFLTSSFFGFSKSRKLPWTLTIHRHSGHVCCPRVSDSFALKIYFHKSKSKNSIEQTIVENIVHIIDVRMTELNQADYPYKYNTQDYRILAMIYAKYEWISREKWNQIWTNNVPTEIEREICGRVAIECAADWSLTE